MLRKPGSSSPGNLGYSTPSKGSNLMEGSLSPISCLDARPLPTAPVPRVKLPGFGVVCALGVQRAGPARPQRPRPRPARPAGGVRNPGCGLGEHESACPGQFAPPPAPAPGTAAVGRAPRPARRARTGATHGGRLLAAGAVGRGRGGVRGAGLRSAPRAPGALRPPAQPRRSRGAERPAPSQAPAGGAPGDPGRGSGRPLLGAPGDSPGVRAQGPAVTSKALAKTLQASSPALQLTCCAARTSQLTSARLAWKVI